jgi:hypothetical protein
VLLALVGVAVAGFLLPGLARLGVIVLAGVGLRVLWRTLPDGPERAVLLPALAAVWAWLLLAWGLGLFSPAVLVGLVVVAGVGGTLWWAYGLGIKVADAVDAEPQAVAVPPPLPEPTPDERLDALLEDAPLEGIEFGEIAATMEPWMKRTTVYLRLKDRAWSLGDGRWRAKPGSLR